MPRKSKYRNKKTKIDGYPGIVFDSRKEARHFLRLKEREKRGEINSLKLQPKFKLTVNDVHVCYYIADFSYYTESDEDNLLIVEDVKSPITSRNPVFRLKKKLMKAVWNVEVIEVI